MRAGIVGLTLLTFAAATWQTSRQIRTALENQGISNAETLARQSRLALLNRIPEYATEAVGRALSSSDVLSLEIADANGRRLTARGRTNNVPLPTKGIPLGLDGARPFVESETGDYWQYVAPVTAGEQENPGFESEVRRPELLGYVRVLQSKATLNRLVWNTVLANLSIALFFAIALGALLELLLRREARPLEDLTALMARAGKGEPHLRASVDGPPDLASMAYAFNDLMVLLEQGERKLRQARDEAQAVARSKAEFATMVSHEVRTPLNGVVGTLDMLKATTLPPKQREFVDLAWNSAQHLLELINNILDYSRLEAGAVELEFISFSIRHLVEDVLELLAPQAHQKGLEIGYLAGPDVPERIRGDALRIKQILTNLLGNAIGFTETGEISVGITFVRKAEGTAELRIEVCDTGIGITEDVRSRIFDSFAQGSAAPTRPHGGSGLGLVICRQLAALMSGHIGVDSLPGGGSCFWLALPSAAMNRESAPAEPIGTGCLALVVAHSRVVAGFLKQQLALWGFDCRHATTTDEALAWLRENPPVGPALVFVDAEFATTAGGELTRRLKGDTRLASLRLILMHDYGLEREPIGSAADAYLAKPIRLERLYDCAAGQLASDSRTAADRRRSSRVLVVEDNRTGQLIAQGMLHMLGCQVALANGGARALLEFKRHPWDLILMDCDMPEMDGYQVTAAIRAMEADSGTRTPVVAMTANPQGVDAEKCLAAGMDDHLGKPLSLINLAAKLDRWLPAESRNTPDIDAPAEDGQQLGDPEVIERTTFDRLRAMLGDAIRAAVGPFLEDIPHYLDEAAQAAANGDAHGLRRTAHKVRDAAASLGATLLADAAKEVEDLAKTGRLADATEAMDRLPAEFALARQALTAELRRAAQESGGEEAEGDPLVLVVDDDRGTRTALRHALQKGGFRTEEAADGVEALALLSRIKPDVVLMDASMPELDGFSACARLKEMPHTREIPVIMVTAVEDNHSVERAFLAGASDYVSKPVQYSVVQQRVRRLVDAKRTERYARYLSHSDAITGLPNRTMFAEQLSHMLVRNSVAQSPVAVLVLDLDRFKFVNDSLGHDVGDQLLKTVAERIKQCVRGNDCVARLGGDEFSVALDELPSAGIAAMAAQKICRVLAEPFLICGHEIFVSVSIGISVFPEDGPDVGTLLRHADTAMYQAKKDGSGFQFYESGMEATVSAHLHLETALRRALERGELEVFYQPIASCGIDHVEGAEALLRWHHPDRGLVSPTEFIPVAEETGLIHPIGEWVLRSACEQVVRWRDRHPPGFHIAVNLSGRQLQQPNFVATVKRIIDETGVDPEQLTLEITESVVMEHAQETIATLSRLKDLRVRLAIDDFGTGYSSLSYLKRFPVDILKVDRSFTMDVPHDTDDAAIVTGIVALAHSLRLKVIAEGVETEEQRRFLLKLGCDYLQGFLLDRPMPAASFEKYFSAAEIPAMKSR